MREISNEAKLKTILTKYGIQPNSIVVLHDRKVKTDAPALVKITETSILTYPYLDDSNCDVTELYVDDIYNDKYRIDQTSSHYEEEEDATKLVEIEGSLGQTIADNIFTRKILDFKTDNSKLYVSRKGEKGKFEVSYEDILKFSGLITALILSYEGKKEE